MILAFLALQLGWIIEPERLRVPRPSVRIMSREEMRLRYRPPF